MESGDVLFYKGYSARPEYSADDRVFYGKILGIRDLVDFQSESASTLGEEFHKAVDDYLDFCKEVGKDPDKGYDGMPDVRPEVLNEFEEMRKDPGKYKRYSSFSDAMKEVLSGD